MACADMVVNLRCERCSCGDTRKESLRQTVIEAARYYLAAHLVAERAAARMSPRRPGSVDEHDYAVGRVDDALQTLRDSLATERVSRG